MITPVVNGQSIEQFIPADLRDPFYHNSEPKYRYAISNGLDPYGFSVNGLVLYLPLWALKPSGSTTIESVDAYRHTCGVTGALWSPNGRAFDGNDDYIDFLGTLGPMKLSGTGTLEVWVYSEEPNNTSSALVSFGDNDADTVLYLGIVNGLIWGNARVAGVSQWAFDSDAQVDDFQKWTHMVLVQDGTEPVMYFNGSLETSTYTVSTDKTLWLDGIAGIDNARVGNRYKGGAASYPFEGTIGEARIYNRALTAAEIAYNRNTTIWRYQ